VRRDLDETFCRKCLRAHLLARYRIFYAKRREEPHMITSAFAGLTCMTVGLVGVITA